MGRTKGQASGQASGQAKGKGNATAPTPKKAKTVNETRAQTLANFKKAGSIVVERNFLPGPTWGNAQQQIADRGWGTLTTISRGGLKSVVYEFYTDLKHKLFTDAGDDTVKVRGKTVKFSADAINAYFALQPPAACEFSRLWEGPSANWTGTVITNLTMLGTAWELTERHPHLPIGFPEKCLSIYGKAWYRFLSRMLLVSSNESRVTVKRALLLFCICKGLPINVGAIINANIIDCACQTTTAAPAHASLITELCKLAKVDVGTIEGDISFADYHLDPLQLSKIISSRYGTPEPNGLSFSSYVDHPKFPKPPPPKKRPRSHGIQIREPTQINELDADE